MKRRSQLYEQQGQNTSNGALTKSGGEIYWS
jgi:hypothetical protein